jgi:isopenicillin-N epimerase
MDTLTAYFQLRDDITFLNHGSFGACPTPVFETYQTWQRKLERQPVEFLGRRAEGLLADARHSLAEYVGAAKENLVFVTNATVGLNTVARALPLAAGDELLTTNHEYGALEKTWDFICRKRNCTIVVRPVPMPLRSPAEVVESIWQGVTSETKVLFISHITSPTSFIVPVAELVRRARAHNILTVIDGAHAPGQIPLDLAALDVDFYAGNCHKWMMAPKGAGFLYAHPRVQPLLEPLVVSWGWHTDRQAASYLVDILEYQGTRDIAAFLSVATAIEFMTTHQWVEVGRQCHHLLRQVIPELTALTDRPDIYGGDESWFAQMAAIALPDPPFDGAALQYRLYNEYGIEVPVTYQADNQYLRISAQGYNTPANMARLTTALTNLLP